MIDKIKVLPDTVTSKILFFDSADLNDLPDLRIVPLFGANGSGKTTLLKQIEYVLQERAYKEKYPNEDSIGESDRILQALRRQRAGCLRKPEISLGIEECSTVFFRYRNSDDNFRNRETGNLLNFDPALLNARYEAQSLSEGQSIIYSIDDLLKGMLKSTERSESIVEGNTHAILLIDEMDSGLSIDNLERCLKTIRKVLKQGRNIQFIISFNNPYFVRFFPHVLSMYDGKIHKLIDSDEMLKELKSNQKMLDKARKSRSRYKIF